MKNFNLICILCVLVLVNGCKKPDAPEPPVENTPKRDIINYKLTVVPRTETGISNNNSHNGDTLQIKVNGNTILYSKGSVTDYYGGKPEFNVKTGDVIYVYYNPGKVVFNGNTMIDENGLAIYVDYNNNRSNLLLKEFNCRCIGVFQKTLE